MTTLAWNEWSDLNCNQKLVPPSTRKISDALNCKCLFMQDNFQFYCKIDSKWMELWWRFFAIIVDCWLISQKKLHHRLTIFFVCLKRKSCYQHFFHLNQFAWLMLAVKPKHVIMIKWLWLDFSGCLFTYNGFIKTYQQDKRNVF